MSSLEIFISGGSRGERSSESLGVDRRSREISGEEIPHDLARSRTQGIFPGEGKIPQICQNPRISRNLENPRKSPKSPKSPPPARGGPGAPLLSKAPNLKSGRFWGYLGGFRTGVFRVGRASPCFLEKPEKSGHKRKN